MYRGPSTGPGDGLFINLFDGFVLWRRGLIRLDGLDYLTFGGF